MKIIGFQDEKREKLIVEMTADELAHLRGYNGFYWMKEKCGRDIQIGGVFAISKMWEEATTALEMHDNAETAAKSLQRAAAKFLKLIGKDAS